MYPKDVPIPPGEEWYYDLAGRVHGPLSRADLEELLSRSGDTAAEVRVRRGVDGAWTPFQSPNAGRVHPAGSLPDWGPAAAQLPAHRSAPIDLGGFLRSHWEVGAAIGGWMLLNALFLLFWPHAHSRERRYLETLRAINTEVQELRSKPASDAEWHDFAERTRGTLAPIVSDLKKTASASEPVKQQLFWSARDLVPRTFGPRTKERDEVDRQLKQYLDAAEREMGDR